MQQLWKGVQQLLLYLYIHSLHDLTTLFLGIYPQGNENLYSRKNLREGVYSILVCQRGGENWETV